MKSRIIGAQRRTYPYGPEEERLYTLVGIRIRRLMCERQIREVDIIRETGLSQGVVNKAKNGDPCSLFVFWKISTALDAMDGDLLPVTATQEDVERELSSEPRRPPLSAVQPLADGPKSAVFRGRKVNLITDLIVKPGQTWTWKTPTGKPRVLFVQWLQDGPGHARTARGVHPQTGKHGQVSLAILRNGKFDAKLVETRDAYVFIPRAG